MKLHLLLLLCTVFISAILACEPFCGPGGSPSLPGTWEGQVISETNNPLHNPNGPSTDAPVTTPSTTLQPLELDVHPDHDHRRWCQPGCFWHNGYCDCHYHQCGYGCYWRYDHCYCPGGGGNHCPPGCFWHFNHCECHHHP